MSKIKDMIEDVVEGIIEDTDESSDVIHSQVTSKINDDNMSIWSKLTTAKIAIIAGGSIAIIAILLSVFVFDPFHLNLSFFGRKLEIEKTNNIVTGIKKISEFTTACFYEEIVLQDFKYKTKTRSVYKKVDTGNFIKDKLKLGKDLDGVVIDSTKVGQMAVIVHGKVRAGYNLSKMATEDIMISDDTLFIKLPQVEVFDVIVNPSDLEIFDRQGEWNDEEVKSVVSKAKGEIEKDAMEHGLIEKASSCGKEKIEQLFKSFGFHEVQIQQND